jgi:hypothetical protein
LEEISGETGLMLVPDRPNLRLCEKTFPEIPPPLPFSKGGDFIDSIRDFILSLGAGD